MHITCWNQIKGIKKSGHVGRSNKSIILTTYDPIMHHTQPSGPQRTSLSVCLLGCLYWIMSVGNDSCRLLECDVFKMTLSQHKTSPVLSVIERVLHWYTQRDHMDLVPSTALTWFFCLWGIYPVWARCFKFTTQVSFVGFFLSRLCDLDSSKFCRGFFLSRLCDLEVGGTHH